MVSAFIAELWHVGLYKRSQGRVTRQVTFAAMALAWAFGMWRLNQYLIGYPPMLSYGLPAGLLLIGLWALYRLVNVPAFADFLIAVEAEMNKVSWPSKMDLYRSCIVVLVTIITLTVALFAFDLFWSWFFKLLGIL